MFVNFRNLFLFISFLPLASLQGEEIVHNVTLPDIYFNSWSGNVSLPKFDPSLGQLQRVDLEMRVIGVGKFAFESLEKKLTFNGQNVFEHEVLLKRPDLTTMLRTYDNQAIEYSVGIFDGEVDFEGSSGFTNYAFFNGAAENGEWTGDDFSRFIGSSSIASNSVGDLELPVTTYSAGALTSAGINVCGYGSVTRVLFEVRYTYSPVPVCDLGVSETDGEPSVTILSCDGPSTKVQLNSSGSSGVGLSYKWRSDCPGALFSNSSSPDPILTFDSQLADGTPTACSVGLTVMDTFGQTAACRGVLKVKGCNTGCNEPIDLCGVCGGNNECLGCNEINIQDEQFGLDGGLDKLFRNLKKSVIAARKSTGKKRYGAKILKAGADQYTAGWQLVWEKETTVSVCENTILCQSISNQSFDADYLRTADSLDSLTKQVLNSYKAKNKAEARVKRAQRRKAKDIRQSVTEILGTLPEESICGPVS